MPSTTLEKKLLNINWEEWHAQLPFLVTDANITIDELILIKFKLLQVTSQNKSINGIYLVTNISYGLT